MKLGFLAVAFVLPFVAPAPLAVALLLLVHVAAHVWLARTARALLVFALVTLALSALFYALMGPSPADRTLAGVGFARADVTAGLVAGVRLSLVSHAAAFGARLVPARELLPYVAHAGALGYLAGALLRLPATLRSDAQRLRDAQAARGHRFTANARSWLPLLVPLLTLSLRRAREQALALALAGVARSGRATPQWLATVATLAALAFAGRLIFAGVPGVSPSFFLVFVAGLAFGPATGLAVGFLQRMATDLALSGFHPILLVMPFVEGGLGAASGLLGRMVNFGQKQREPWAYAGLLAAVAGAVYTIGFSVASDTVTWFFSRWAFPGLSPSADQALQASFVALGLLFNLPAIAFNTVLFGVATYPVLRGLRLSGALPASADPCRRREARLAADAEGFIAGTRT